MTYTEAVDIRLRKAQNQPVDAAELKEAERVVRETRAEYRRQMGSTDAAAGHEPI